MKAGIAKSEITVRAARHRIRDPLYAKALVLDNGHTRAVIIAMDVTAIGARRISQGILPDVGEEFLPKLRRRIQQELQIPPTNVLVNASHTHPPGRMLCSDAEQVERTFAAVRRAVRAMTEVKVGAGVGHEDRITINRTLRLKNGQHWTIRHAYPCPPDDEVAVVGPIDPEIGILRIDRMDGQPLAVVYNFASHLLWGDLHGRITANFPGVASQLIEETLGHGALALFLQGAAGDVVDVLFKDFTRPRGIEPLGVMLGLSTLQALRKISTTTAVSLKVIAETIELPRRTDIPQRLAALRRRQTELLQSLRFTSLNFKSFLPLYLKQVLSPGCPADYPYRYLQAKKIGRDELTAMDSFNRQHIGKYLKNIRVMEELAKIQDDLATLQKHQMINRQSRSRTISAEILGLRIGHCALVSSPAELLVEVGLNVKKASRYKPTLVAAFSNGYLHYSPPAADYDKGGYEVTECLLAPQWQELYEKKAIKIICRL